MKEEIDKLKQELSDINMLRIQQYESNRDPVLEKEYWTVYHKIYYRENIIKIKASQLEYREKGDNREKMRAYSQKYYIEHNDVIQKYKEDNKEKIAQYSKDYYIKNREAVIARVRAYQEKKRNNKDGK